MRDAYRMMLEADREARNGLLRRDARRRARNRGVVCYPGGRCQAAGQAPVFCRISVVNLTAALMELQTLITVSEYLSTSYRPDREYLEGTVTERNAGERDHSRVQTDLSTFLNVRADAWGIRVFVEQRVQVKPTRFRIPDICVVAGPEPEEQILTSPL